MTTPEGIQDAAFPFHGNVRPILNEVIHAIDRLLDTGEATTIDLASLPFGPGELARSIVVASPVSSNLSMAWMTSLIIGRTFP